MSFIECSGCHKNFSIRGYTLHIAKTRNPRCQLPCTPPHAPASQSTRIGTLSLDLFTDEDTEIPISEGERTRTDTDTRLVDDGWGMEDSAPIVPAQSGNLSATLTGIC